MRLLRFIFSGRFWINLLLIAVVIVLVIQGTLYWLETYTRHAESVEVPNLTGYTIDKLDELLINTDLTYEITDSVYSEDFPRGVVILQNPLPQRKVKEGRTIFLSVNSTVPESVAMPDLNGKSRRIAIPILEISGLKLNSIEYKLDNSCTDCVIDQLYKGERIDAGTKIRKGEEIVLVLGRLSNEMTPVPVLRGMTYAEAAELLITQSLNIGQVLACDGCLSANDTTMAFVTGQLPGGKNLTSLGSFVDVYLSVDSLTSEYESANSDTL